MIVYFDDIKKAEQLKKDAERLSDGNGKSEILKAIESYKKEYESCMRMEGCESIDIAELEGGEEEKQLIQKYFTVKDN